jgi:hypothetical protein
MTDLHATVLERDEVLRQLEDATNQTWLNKRRRWARLVRAQAEEIDRLRKALEQPERATVKESLTTGEQPEQENPTRQMPEWMDYDQATDVLTIHGRRYSAAMFGERGFLSPAGTLLQVAEGQPDCVTLMTVAALEQPEQDTDCHTQGICQRSGYGIGQPVQEPVDIKPPNPEGATQCIVRWWAETPAGWVGAWDREALDQFTHPPRREWRGLSEEEAAACWSVSTVRTWQAIEAALKEKNHD